MIIVNDKISLEEIKKMQGEFFDNMIKGVVDIERGILALNAGMHADLETLLLDDGSDNENLWGINLYPDNDKEGFIEFDSIINIKPALNNRSRYVEDEEIRKKIVAVVNKSVV